MNQIHPLLILCCMFRKFYTWRSYDSICQKKLTLLRQETFYISTLKDFQRKIIFPTNQFHMFHYFWYSILGSQWKTKKQNFYMHVLAFQMNSYFVILRKVVQMHGTASFKSTNSDSARDVLINHCWGFQNLKDLRSMCWVHLGCLTSFRLQPDLSVL